MSKFVSVLVLGVFVLVLVVHVNSLACLRCNSTDVNSRCRFGSRSKNTRRRQICQGSDAACFAVATVNEFGSAYFQRGCTKEDVCKEREDTDIEFCRTCKSQNCNYDVMELDKEVEDYLNEVRDYNYSIEASKKNTTVTTINKTVKKEKSDKNETIRNEISHNKTSSGIMTVLKELLTKSSSDTAKNPESLVDEVLSNHFVEFGSKTSNPDIAFADEDVVSAHNEDVEFKDDDFDDIDHFDFDVRMDRTKPV